jgi:methionyl-tRNA synthetase
VSFYVTTPIYYVNATPHVGHAYTTIAADILARHRRQRGEETFFLTGTDEHGSNIARVAEEAGVEPKEFVDRNAATFIEMTRRINVSNDFFIRTTDERHGQLVQEFLQRIYDAGEIYEGVYAGLYCSRCESFYTEAELIDGKCPQHGIPPEWVEEKN